MTVTSSPPPTQGTEPEIRTYGNWRKPTSPGLPGLGLLGTVVVLGGIVLTVLVELIGGLIAGGIALAVVLVGVAPIMLKNRAGRNGWQLITARLAWARGRRRGQDLYRSGIAGPVAYGSHALPGLLARSTLIEAVDAHGNPFAMLHIPATRQYSVVLAADPEGSTLVDADTVDTWVARWGRWLADLSRGPNLVAVSATSESAVDPGNRLAEEVTHLLSPDAPPLAAGMMTEIASTYSAAAPSVTGWVALTYSATRKSNAERELSRNKGGKRRTTLLSAKEMAAQIGSRLPGLIRELSGTGAGGGSHAFSTVELTGLVRTAYDPAAGNDLDAIRARHDQSSLSWKDAGPVAHLETWDAYRHDGAASISYQMTEAPRGLVQSTVLRSLLSPTADLARKRVTLIFRPHDPASAARLADSDVRTEIGRSGARKGETRAGDTLALQAARQTAAEEASGAGLTRFSLLVTATVNDISQLDHAADVIDQAAAGSRLGLRRAYGAQSATFAAGLGIGLVLNDHVAVPETLRNHL